MAKKFWTNKERDLAARLWADGFSRTEIARETGRTIYAVQSYARANRDLFPKRVPVDKKDGTSADFRATLPAPLMDEVKRYARKYAVNQSVIAERALRAFLKENSS